jgi:signal transduction histidine kinase
VLTACDGQEGLERARDTLPDLIVTDVMMPKLGGDELVRAVRGLPELDATPIIVLTARADEERRVRLLAGGAQDYVAKPFSPDELLARVRNLTLVKRAREILQKELATKRGDLEDLAREVTHKKRELEDALRAKTTFLSLVSHELTTPLQAMRLSIESLLSSPERLSAAQLGKIGKIERGSTRLLDMIEALLEFVRLESGRLEVRLEDVRLEDVASSVVEDFAPQARQKGLDLHLSVREAIPALHTDARLLRLILANLVGNAVKYTQVGGVDVALERGAAGGRVRVADTGPGIPLEKQGAIFEPFTQLEAMRHKHLPGVGLGLTLVREMTRAIGAEISLESRVGEGSTFTIELHG